MNNYYYSLNC